MKKTSLGFLLVLFVTSVCFFVNCGGGGGGSDGGTGTLSMNIADARPAFPDDLDVAHVFVTINEISVHKSGGGWATLGLPDDGDGEPGYEIDLLQYYNGNTTALVLPIVLSSGRYTQIRFGVQSAYMVTSVATGAVIHQLEIPSAYLKTDNNFEFDIPNGGSVALTIDFDLSQSIVATGTGTYQLKPILHIVKAPTTITGSIASIRTYTTAEIVVTWDKDGDGVMDAYPEDEEYTRLIVEKSSTVNPTPFTIYWVVPNERYFVQIFINDSPIFPAFTVEPVNVPEGAEYELNGGNPI